MDSPIWDIRDCAPVYTEAQIGQIVGRHGAVQSPALIRRLERYYQTADVLDAMCDGVFFAVDFAQLVCSAVKQESGH